MCARIAGSCVAQRSAVVHTGLVVLFALWAERADATIFNIANGDIPGLIAAINASNGSVGPDVINLAAAGTYTLTATDNPNNGLPIITSQITLNGNASILERSSAGATPDFRIIEVMGPAAGDLTINDLTIRNGHLVGNPGGGISNSGIVKLTNVVVTGNGADGGAGIFNVNGSVDLTNSTLSLNTDRFFGAGVWNDGSNAVLTATNTTIADNTGRLRGTGI